MFTAVWTLGHFAILYDGKTFAAVRGLDFATAEILDVCSTRREALRVISEEASV